MKNEKKNNNIINFPNSLTNGEREVEAILFAASEPLEIESIEARLNKKVDVKKILKKLEKIYENRGFNLVCISNKWSFRTSAKLSSLMVQEKTVEKKLSRAAIETLSIIVYPLLALFCVFGFFGGVHEVVFQGFFHFDSKGAKAHTFCR